MVETYKEELEGVDVTGLVVFKSQLGLRAVQFIQKLYDGQYRKNRDTLASHFIRTAIVVEQIQKLVIEPEKFQKVEVQERAIQVAIAAILNGVLEEKGVSVDQIRETFGQDVAEIVQEVYTLTQNITDHMNKWKHVLMENAFIQFDTFFTAQPNILQDKASQLDLQQQSIQRDELEQYLQTLSATIFFTIKNPFAALIKLADRLQNMRTVYALQPHVQKQLALETLFLWCGVAERLGLSHIKHELEDLSFLVLDPSTYLTLYNQIQKMYYLQDAIKSQARVPYTSSHLKAIIQLENQFRLLFNPLPRKIKSLNSGQYNRYMQQQKQLKEATNVGEGQVNIEGKPEQEFLKPHEHNIQQLQQHQQHQLQQQYQQQHQQNKNQGQEISQNADQETKFNNQMGSNIPDMSKYISKMTDKQFEAFVNSHMKKQTQFVPSFGFDWQKNDRKYQSKKPKRRYQMQPKVEKGSIMEQIINERNSKPALLTKEQYQYIESINQENTNKQKEEYQKYLIEEQKQDELVMQQQDQQLLELDKQLAEFKMSDLQQLSQDMGIDFQDYLDNVQHLKANKQQLYAQVGKSNLGNNQLQNSLNIKGQSTRTWDFEAEQTKLERDSYLWKIQRIKNLLQQKDNILKLRSEHQVRSYSRLSRQQVRLRNQLAKVVPFGRTHFRHFEYVGGETQGLTAFRSKLQQELMIRGSLNGLDIRYEGRIKSIFSTYQKMQRKNIAIQDVYDRQALRIVIDDENGDRRPDAIEACYNVQKAIERLFKGIPKAYDDYISQPKPSGYQSIHLVVYDENLMPVEVQIRTQEMHDIAEGGKASHWMYKFSNMEDEEPQNIFKRREIYLGMPVLQGNLINEELYPGMPVLQVSANGTLRDGVVYQIDPNSNVIEVAISMGGNRRLPDVVHGKYHPAESYQQFYEMVQDIGPFGNYRYVVERYTLTSEGEFQKIDQYGQIFPQNKLNKIGMDYFNKQQRSEQEEALKRQLARQKTKDLDAQHQKLKLQAKDIDLVGNFMDADQQIIEKPIKPLQNNDQVAISNEQQQDSEFNKIKVQSQSKEDQEKLQKRLEEQRHAEKISLLRDMLKKGKFRNSSLVSDNRQ